MTKKAKRQWQRVGEIGIDSGVCWLGDPEYVLSGRDARLSWQEFLKGEEHARYPQVHQWGDAMKGWPLGVSVRAGYGDGRYDVFVQYDEERYVTAVKIVFIDDDSDEEEAGE